MKIALVAGSTGLTGKELLNRLLTDSNYHQVFSLVRQYTGSVHDKLFEIVVDFEALDSSLSAIKKADDVYCCLGTTMKKAKTKENFYRVDHDFPLNLAKWAEKHGVNNFLCISALGASETSAIFYNRVKGEMERDIGKLKILSVTFFRPSLLLGERKEKRVAERLAMKFADAFSFLFTGPLKKYKGIRADRVAEEMIHRASIETPGVTVIESVEMNN